MNCRYVAANQPRVLKGRHEDCDDETCRGCAPCPERHCQVCGREHVTVDSKGSDQTCATCLGETREDLQLVVELSGRTLAEAVHKGVDSEAAMLAGRAIDTPEGIEAWNHRAMSAAMGRIAVLDQADERHPLWVLGTWEMLVREHLNQPSEARITVSEAARYLGEHLTRLAHDVEFAFDELARDLRRCRVHLENVLQDGERPKRSEVPCLDCGRRLERRYPAAGIEDVYRCPKCERVYTQGDFARAKADHLSKQEAERFVLIADAAQAIERSEFTIRTWVNRECVGAMCDLRTHRIHVWWPDVRRQNVQQRVAEPSKVAGS